MTDEPDRRARPGHGDHWLAALDDTDPRLRDVVTVPVDAPETLRLQRTDLTESLDMVQVTLRRRLMTSYPEPRATLPATVRPRELVLWETRVEGWLVAEHEGAGALTAFVTDLSESAHRYARSSDGRPIELELGAIAYVADRAPFPSGPARLRPAGREDPRFLPDDYAFDGQVVAARTAGAGEVLDLAFHGGLVVPVVTRHPTGAAPGERVQGYLWLTGRLPLSR